MKRKIPSIKLTKNGKEQMNVLLKSNIPKYQKSLLTAINQRSKQKNLSISDCKIFEYLVKKKWNLKQLNGSNHYMIYHQ